MALSDDAKDKLIAILDRADVEALKAIKTIDDLADDGVFTREFADIIISQMRSTMALGDELRQQYGKKN